MKKLSILVGVLIATFFSTTAFAEGIHNYNLAGTTVSVSSQGKSLMIYLNNVQNDMVKVAINDDKGNNLLTESIKASKKYNLSKLPTGTYAIVVSKKDVKTSQSFELTAAVIALDETTKKAVFTPIIIQKEHNIMVNALLGQYSNINVRIKDAEGKVIFEDKNYVVFNIHKAFNIDQLPKGAYTIVVEAGDEIFSKSFVK